MDPCWLAFAVDEVDNSVAEVVVVAAVATLVVLPVVLAVHLDNLELDYVDGVAGVP